MRQLKLISGIFLFLVIILFFSIRITGQEILPSRTLIIDNGANLSTIVLKPKCAIEEQVKAGQDLLKGTSNLEFVEITQRQKDRRGRYINVIKLQKKQIELAILDTSSCDIFEKRYWLEEDDIEKGNMFRRNHVENPGDVPRFIPDDPTDLFRVVVRWWNNFNSDLAIEDGSLQEQALPPRYLVVANKFLLGNDSFAYPQEITGKKYSDMVYSPYSRDIHFPELAESGREFMSRNVDEVVKELKDLNIESIARPGLLVTDVVSANFVKNLLITEQVDPSTIFASQDNGLNVSERVFVRYGLNKDRAFHFTYSKTGASGAGQIMPGTYASIVKRYPGANLIKDIDIGRVDLKNGLKATFLVLDDHFATVVNNANKTSKGRSILNSKKPQQIEEIMAASYNGGPGKYQPLTGNISLAIRETVDFVRKFKMIRDLKLFE